MATEETPTSQAFLRVQASQLVSQALPRLLVFSPNFLHMTATMFEYNENSEWSTAEVRHSCIISRETIFLPFATLAGHQEGMTYVPFHGNLFFSSHMENDVRTAVEDC